MERWSSSTRNVKTNEQNTNLSETIVETNPWRSKGMLEFLNQDDETEMVQNSRTTAESYDHDRAVLRALGKKQLLNRRFGFLSMVGFTSTMMGTWEALGLSLQGGLMNGGPVALVYGFILVFFGTLATCASIAELASMFPTAGGQYHFVALLSPKRYKEFLSWMAGWISVLAWQANTASCAYLAALAIQSILFLNDEWYTPQRWHVTLFFIAVILLAAFANTALIRVLPAVESGILVFHVAGFFCIIIPLIMFGPRSTSKFVFTEFVSNGGWNNDAVTWSVGLISSTFSFLCYDGACHMSEEVENASVAVPRSMVITVLLNGLLGFAFLITLLYYMGDLTAAIAAPIPLTHIFYNATNSKAVASAMTSVFASMAVLAAIAIMASCSRLTWAFARDRGLPYSSYLSVVSERWKIPLRAIVLTTVINVFLSMLILESTAAFSAIISLSIVAIYTSYILPIVLMLRLRIIAPKSIRYGPFNLGRWGIFVNVVGIVYSIYTSIFLLFPSQVPVTGMNMNYSVVVMMATVVFALGLWFLKGKREYRGPLKEV